MRYRYYTADVFTDRIFGGNPLAVFPNAQGLDTHRMQQAAREINYSVTTFVVPATRPEAACRLRLFTPATEMQFAGHPTVGTAFVLASIGDLPLSGAETRILFEEAIGPVPVVIRAAAGHPVFVQLSAALMPQLGPPPPPIGDLTALLCLDRSDILDGEFMPQAVSCGVPFLIVPLRNLDAVRRARVRLDLWELFLAPYWAPHIYVFTFEPERPDSDLHARMFAPALGMDEDPATGSAATALAGYLGLLSDRHDATLRWVAEQGFEMGRPSILEIQAEKRAGNMVAIRVGGASVMVARGEMEIP